MSAVRCPHGEGRGINLNFLEREFARRLPTPVLWSFRRSKHWPPAGVDSLIVSFPKAGRTWLRVLIASALAMSHKSVVDKSVVDAEVATWLDDNVIDAAGRRIMFSHGLVQVLRARPVHVYAFSRLWQSSRSVLLCRDPRDVIVSNFFQRTNRSVRSDVPTPTDISTFVRHPFFGMPRLIGFMNAWQDAVEASSSLAQISYEALHRDPAGVLTRAMRYLFGIDLSAETVDAAIDYASFDNMRAMEVDGKFSGSKRLSGGSSASPNSLKTRKGRIGGYRSVLTAGDLDYIEDMIGRELSPALRYRTPGEGPADSWPGGGGCHDD